MTRMPRPARNDLIRYLIRNGFSVRNQRGSHVKLRRDNVTVIVPTGNQRIRPGLLLKILRDGGISRDAFVNDYGRNSSSF